MITKTVKELIENHVTFSLEGLDRLYLNAYVPILQTEAGVAYYFRECHNKRVASTILMAPMTQRFVELLKAFIQSNKLDVVRFKSGQRKDDVTQHYLQQYPNKIGLLYAGVAQEKFNTFRTTKERDEQTGQSRAKIYRSSVMCNQYYFYLVDEEFGPLFIKMASYFPYTMRICMNGHEYLKQQLKKEGIAFEALDNGLFSCANPKRAQAIMDQLNEQTIEATVRKWLKILPSPFTQADHDFGIHYDLSMLQAEFALTQVFDKPRHGRAFFEEVIREHIDLGRPENVSLIFNRRVTKRTPTRCCTRVITHDVIPSLNVSYKYSKIKQYFKCGKALRTETVINNPRDFHIGKRLCNFSTLRAYGLETNRRLLDVQKLSQDCLSGGEIFEELVNPIVVEKQRASALKFGDERVMTLLAALSIFSFQVEGFTNKMLRTVMATLLGKNKEGFSQGKMSYDLRRLRLRGYIVRETGTQRYRVTEKGLRISFFISKFHHRLINPTFGNINDAILPNEHSVILNVKQLNRVINNMIDEIKFAA